MTNLKQAGYAKIKSIEIETFYDDVCWNDRHTGWPHWSTVKVFGRLVIKTTEGDTFVRDTLNDETEEGNKARLLKRGFTDDLCILL